MHYSNLVIVPKPEDGETVDALVDAAMEDGRDDWWDWFQIGGRWTGALDGYDPEADPANIQPCELCGGTGNRATFRHEPTDNQHPTGCNGCLGKGVRAKWPTNWSRHDGDVMPLSSLTPEQYAKFHRVVIHEYGAYGGERFEPRHASASDRFVRQDKPPIEWLMTTFGEHLAVVVDNHN